MKDSNNIFTSSSDYCTYVVSLVKVILFCSWQRLMCQLERLLYLYDILWEGVLITKVQQQWTNPLPIRTCFHFWALPIQYSNWVQTYFTSTQYFAHQSDILFSTKMHFCSHPGSTSIDVKGLLRSSKLQVNAFVSIKRWILPSLFKLGGTPQEKKIIAPPGFRRLLSSS